MLQMVFNRLHLKILNLIVIYALGKAFLPEAAAVENPSMKYA